MRVALLLFNLNYKLDFFVIINSFVFFYNVKNLFTVIFY